MRRRLIWIPVLVGGILLVTACSDEVSTVIPKTIETGKIATIEPVLVKPTTEGQTPTEQAPTGQTPVDQTPINQTSTDQTLIDQTSVGETLEKLLPKESREVQITISAAGDVTLGNYFGQDYEGSFRQTYEKVADDAYFFENVADIFAADDMTLVNLEGPLTTAEKRREWQQYCICGDPSFASILTAGNVDAVSMANNHRMDYFEEGTADTVAAVTEQSIVYAYDGIYALYEVKGIRIGYVSVNVVGQGTGVEKYLKEGISQWKKEGVDLILACCHWGIEREFYPEEYQASLGKKCIDWGADLVIGCHPHVIQGIEEYKGKFIVYSLGNFCFGANRNPKDKDCIIYQQTFTFVDGEKKEDQAMRIIPCLVSSVKYRNDYKPTPATGEDYDRILGRMREYSADFGVSFDQEGNYEMREEENQE